MIKILILFLGITISFSVLLSNQSFAVDFRDSSGYTPNWAKDMGIYQTLARCAQLEELNTADGDWCLEWMGYVLDQGPENFPESATGKQSTIQSPILTGSNSEKDQFESIKDVQLKIEQINNRANEFQITLQGEYTNRIFYDIIDTKTNENIGWLTLVIEDNKLPQVLAEVYHDGTDKSAQRSSEVFALIQNNLAPGWADSPNLYEVWKNQPYDDMFTTWELVDNNNVMVSSIKEQFAGDDDAWFGLTINYNVEDFISVEDVELAAQLAEKLYEEKKLEDVQSTEEGGCLIATAAFGSELHPQVQLLREVRNNIISIELKSGTSFMSGFNQFYYVFSPTIADWERQNIIFKEAVKIVLTPLLASVFLLNHSGIESETEMLAIGVGVILLNIGMYFVAPIVILLKIKSLHQKKIN